MSEPEIRWTDELERASRRAADAVAARARRSGLVDVGYATVVENARLYANTFVTWFRAPELAHGAYPG